MGCDIHVHTEVKVNGEWHHYGHPNVGRYYPLFEKMAGVRGEPENAIILPRGIPDDATFLTKLDYERWRGDAHHLSWFGPHEIIELEDWWKQNREDWIEEEFDYLFNNSWGGLWRYDEKWNDLLIEDVRFIFWFDN